MPRQLGYATAALLAAIARGNRYGLDMMQATGLPSGTVYPTLTRLENRGFVVGTWEAAAIAERDGRPRRRYYRITRAGRLALADSVESFGTLTAGSLRPGAPGGKS